MVKVMAIVPCTTCKGRAFLPTEEQIFIGGWKYFRHITCHACQGRGTQVRWIPLYDLAQLLDEIRKHPRKGVL